MTEQRVKYPRTFHLPWSEGATSDDKVVQNVDYLNGLDVVVTLKMDGENTTLYRDGLHARSLDSAHHESRSWVKGFHAGIAGQIPERVRICGENMFATHSIHYEDLGSYFLGFSMWYESQCLGWRETLGWFVKLGITPVPTIYEGPFSEEAIRKAWTTELAVKHEGYVVRPKDGCHLDRFNQYVLKYVRKDHVQTDDHWLSRPVIPNKLKGETK